MNQFRMTLEEFAVKFEPDHGWYDRETLEKDYMAFLRAIDGCSKEEILGRIMKA